MSRLPSALVVPGILALLLLVGGCSRSDENAAPEGSKAEGEAVRSAEVAPPAADATSDVGRTIELGWKVLAMDLRADGARALLCGRASSARMLAELNLETFEPVRSVELPEGAGCAVSYGADGSIWVSYAVNGRGTVREWTEEALVEAQPRDARVPFGRWQDSEGRTLRSRRLEDGRRMLLRDPGPAAAPVGGAPNDPLSRGQEILTADRIQLVDFDDKAAVIQVWEENSPSGRILDLVSLAVHPLPGSLASANISGRAGVSSERREVCATTRDGAVSAIHLFSIDGTGLRTKGGLPASTGGRCAVLPDGQVLTTTQTGLLVTAI